MAESKQREPKIIKEILVVFVLLILIGVFVGVIAMLNVGGLTLFMGFIGMFLAVATMFIGVKSYVKKYVAYKIDASHEQ